MFNENDYEKELKTIDIEKANKLGISLLIPVFLFFTALHFILWKDELLHYFRNEFTIMDAVRNLGLFFIAMLLGIVLHELIHGIFFAMFAKRGFRSIRFGVLWQYLAPYCHCKEPLQIKHYRLGALAPAIFLGVIPTIIGLVIGRYLITFLGIFFIVAAIGDFMVIYLLKDEKSTDYAQDHPSEAGCYIFRKKVI